MTAASFSSFFLFGPQKIELLGKRLLDFAYLLIRVPVQVQPAANRFPAREKNHDLAHQHVGPEYHPGIGGASSENDAHQQRNRRVDSLDCSSIDQVKGRSW